MTQEAWLWLALGLVAVAYRWVGKTIVSKPKEYHPLVFLKYRWLVFCAVFLPIVALVAVAIAGFLVTPLGWWYLIGTAVVFFGLSVRPHVIMPESETLRDDDPMRSMLDEQRKTFSIDMTHAIRAAVTSCDIEGFRALVRHLPNLNERIPPEDWTLLHFLAAQGQATKPVHAIMADDLLKAGAEVDCRTRLGWTPIHMVAGQGQKQACELAKVLIVHGADLKAVDKMGADWRMHWQHGNEIRGILEEASSRS